MLLKHIMLSHHGEYEFGSPKRPKIQEAIVINYLDDLAAKINNFQATLKKEHVAEGEWTGFSKMHDRYLYRQRALYRKPMHRDIDRTGSKREEPQHSQGQNDADVQQRSGM